MLGIGYKVYPTCHFLMYRHSYLVTSEMEELVTEGPQRLATPLLSTSGIKVSKRMVI